MPGRLKGIGISMGVVLVVLVGGCIDLFVTDVTIVNEAGKPLSDVSVALGGKVIWNGDLSIGASKTAYGLPDRDGAARVVYTVDGKQLIGE